MARNVHAQTEVQRPPPMTPGVLFGLGLGGFVDGIVLHQTLQWHHMVSSVDGVPTDTVEGVELNTLADGFFHLVTWLCAVAASVTALQAWRRAGWPRTTPSMSDWCSPAGGSSTSWRG